MPHDELDIQDYLEATSDAAKRTRNASISVVVASVLVFAGLLNSLQHSWMLQRLRTWNEMDSAYVRSKIGEPPKRTVPMSSVDPAYEAALRGYLDRYKEFYSALIRTYVDNSYVIRVPFFGFRVDANDLGLIGGIGFVVLLIILRFNISREVDNLRMAFAEAKRLNQLSEFYVLLAMRQVFTVPATDAINRGPFMVWVPKLFCFAPLAVHISVTIHDFVTVGIGHALSDTHTAILFASEFVLAVAIAILTRMVVKRMLRVDSIWDEYWPAVQRELVRRRETVDETVDAGA
jgi:hypothetical protein